MAQDIKPKVNFIIGHKIEIFMKDKTPCGERRVYDPDFWAEIKKSVTPNFLDLYKPFDLNLPFSQSITNIAYHLNNARTVKKHSDKDAISHIFFEEESALLRLIKLKKTVVTCLDIIPIAFPQELSPHYKIFYKTCVKGLKKADLILTISDHTKKDLIKFLKINPLKIVTAYLGINKIFKQEEVPHDAYAKFGLSPSRKYLLSVGGLHIKRKNTKILVEILPELIKKIPGIELIICGYKNENKNIPLFDFIKKNNLNNKIHLLERVSDQDLCYLYNLAHIFIFPSLYEGFGLPIVEAMACGTPVISANNSSLPEAGGKAALYYDTNNKEELIRKIVELERDKQLYQHCVTQGLAHCAGFTWKNYAKQVLMNYERFETN